MFRQGDIVLTIFPYTDLTGSKLRPALIISSDTLNKTGDFVCLQITSKMFDDAFFIKLDNKMLSEPLLIESGIRVQKIFTLNQKLIERKISSVNTSGFNSVINTFSEKVISTSAH